MMRSLSWLGKDDSYPDKLFGPYDFCGSDETCTDDYNKHKNTYDECQNRFITNKAYIPACYGFSDSGLGLDFLGEFVNNGWSKEDTTGLDPCFRHMEDYENWLILPKYVQPTPT